MHRKRPSPLTRRPRTRGAAGFTLMELIVLVALVGVVAIIYGAFVQGYMSRARLRGAVNEVSFLISKARLEAIQRGVITVVEYDEANGLIRAYADVNGESLVGSDGYDNYLRFDPESDPTLDTQKKQTDYEIGVFVLEQAVVAAPSGYDAVEGFTAVPGAPVGTLPVLTFSETGVPDELGAFRLGDALGAGGEPQNCIETAVMSLAGKVEVRKYLLAGDAPGGVAGFFPEGQDSSGESIWEWY